MRCFSLSDTFVHWGTWVTKVLFAFLKGPVKCLHKSLVCCHIVSNGAFHRASDTSTTLFWPQTNIEKYGNSTIPFSIDVVQVLQTNSLPALSVEIFIWCHLDFGRFLSQPGHGFPSLLPKLHKTSCQRRLLSPWCSVSLPQTSVGGLTYSPELRRTWP